MRRLLAFILISATAFGQNSSINGLGSQSVTASHPYVAGGGSANAQTATYSPAVTTLATGLELCWLPTAANTTTTPTFAPNGLTAKTITKTGTAALAGSDLTTTAIACAIYDGTQWQLQNPQTLSSGGTGLLAGILSTTPSTTSTGFTTAWNQGGTFSSANSVIGLTMYDTTSAAAIKMQGWYKTYPGTAFTATALFSLPPTGASGDNFGFAAMASPTGHLIRWSTRQTGSTSQFGQYIESLNSPTSFNAAITNSQTNFGNYIWMRYKDDGTNIISSFSNDGVNWFQLDSRTKSGSFLGSGGFVDFGIFIDPEATALGTTLMSYSETFP